MTSEEYAIKMLADGLHKVMISDSISEGDPLQKVDMIVSKAQSGDMEWLKNARSILQAEN